MINERELIAIPKDVLAGVYKILCNVPFSLGGMECHPESLEDMKAAHRWLLNFGEENKLESR